MEGTISPRPAHIWQVEELEVARIGNDRAVGSGFAGTGGSFSCFLKKSSKPTFYLLKALTMRSGDPAVQMKVRIKGTKEAYGGDVVWASQDPAVVRVLMQLRHIPPQALQLCYKEKTAVKRY